VKAGVGKSRASLPIGDLKSGDVKELRGLSGGTERCDWTLADRFTPCDGTRRQQQPSPPAAAAACRSDKVKIAVFPTGSAHVCPLDPEQRI